jgi:hypothetical protein
MGLKLAEIKVEHRIPENKLNESHFHKESSGS